MRVARLLLVSVAACYDPEAVSCTVSCAAADECATGQLCGSDGFCAAPEVAGRCASATGDEDEAVKLVALRVVIEGDGKVSIDGVGSCDSAIAGATCTFSVTQNLARQVKAIENGDREFEQWTAGCSGASTTCAITPVTSVTQVGARFE